MYKVGIIGCGAIFGRHVDVINKNENFSLISVCDIDTDKITQIKENLKIPAYYSYKKMIESEDINFAVIASPNSYHTDQAISALENNCDVLIEKPVAFSEKDVKKIASVAQKNNRKAYCVLQVRLNEIVLFLENLLKNKTLGDIRGVSLVQRWQRPLDYFSGWRNDPKVGGGSLYEVGIHYIDIMQKLLGIPKVVATKTYKTKHVNSNIEDTVYSIIDYGDFGGNIEVNVSSEPENLECSLTILGSDGFIKLGGKAMDKIESFGFLNKSLESIMSLQIDAINNRDSKFNNYGTHLGSCPNHAGVYTNSDLFDIAQASNAVSIIEEIYSKSEISYV